MATSDTQIRKDIPMHKHPICVQSHMIVLLDSQTTRLSSEAAKFSSPISNTCVESMMSNSSLLGLCHSSELVGPQAQQLEQPRISPARLTSRSTTNQAKTWGWLKAEAGDHWLLPFALSLFYCYSQILRHFLSTSKQQRIQSRSKCCKFSNGNRQKGKS